MGNVLCKNRANRSNNATNAKNPVDRVIGECMQICPNGIRKKKHFWEKQVFETAPPQEPLQEQPKLQNKNGWQNASLTVPDHPVAPPRKKRTLNRTTDPSEKIEIEDNHLNGERQAKYNERSVDPPETTHITKTTTITTTTNTTNEINEEEKKPDMQKKVTRTISKVGNKKSDKFFGESLSDLSTDYENNTTLESTQTLTTSKPTNDVITSNEQLNKNNLKKENHEIEIITLNTINDNKDSSDKVSEHDELSAIELPRESVVDLVEDIEEELNRKITKERGNLMFAIEKQITQNKPNEKNNDMERFKNDKPCVEEIIVPVRKQYRHICDDDEKLREIITEKHEHTSLNKVNIDENDQETNIINQMEQSAPKKPQRDFAKYRKSINSDDFDTSQIITEAINEKIENNNQSQIKVDNSAQTTGRLVVREKANHAKITAEKITKNIKSLIDETQNQESESANLPLKENSTVIIKTEMKNFLNNIEKLKNEINTNKNNNYPDEVEIEAKNLVDNILDSAQNCINSGILQSELEINAKPKSIENELSVKIPIVSDTNKEHSKDFLQDHKIITVPLQNLSDKTKAALKEAQALKQELNSSLLSEFSQSENLLNETGNFKSKNLQDVKSDNVKENIKKEGSEANNTNANNNIKNKELVEVNSNRDKFNDDCINCMKNDAVKVISEVVEYAEKVVNDSKLLNENSIHKSNKIAQNGGNEEIKIKKLMKKPSVVLFEENITNDFIAELKKDASQTIEDVCQYAKNAVLNDDNTNITDNNNEIEIETNEKPEGNPLEQKNAKIQYKPKPSSFRPSRISEIIPPTQIQQRVYRRSFSNQSTENFNQKIGPHSNEDILSEIFTAVHGDHEISKSTNNILGNDSVQQNIPRRPTRNSEIKSPSVLKSEKMLYRCLSTQSYLTPNLIEKIALQANILSMPDHEYNGTNDGSSLVSPICRLESKRSIINSQSSLNSEKSGDIENIKSNNTAIVPPLPPKKPLKDENCKLSNDGKNISNVSDSTKQKNKKSENTPLSSPSSLKEQKNLTPITSPLTTRSPSPARPSRIPELPKSKLTKRLSRSLSKQSNPDLTEIRKSQELSITLNKFLKEKDLKAQEILDLIEFEFGNCMLSELLPEEDKKIINELKLSVQKEQQKKSSPLTSKPPQKSPPSRSASRELLVRQNSQSSDSSSSKKSPDRLKTSRIPVLKNNKTQELQNIASEFRRHSIDDLDSWFNPIKLNSNQNRRLRKRDNSLQLDYNSEENSMNSSLTEHNVALKQFLDKTSKTKSNTDLKRKSLSVNLTPAISNQSIQNQKVIDQNDHSALLKYLDK